MELINDYYRQKSIKCRNKERAELERNLAKEVEQNEIWEGARPTDALSERSATVILAPQPSLPLQNPAVNYSSMCSNVFPSAPKVQEVDERRTECFETGNLGSSPHTQS